ncbi:pentapeptide repeat-containing protein [bacterium]|nr:pentapeptide repeat-containing protein [bacterium]MBU1883297.1 pentapeptide repeat-containing protein [bacterium]
MQVKKEYIQFSGTLEKQIFQADSETIKYGDEILVLSGIDFNNGLLSFEEDKINCSEGSSRWEKSIFTDPDSIDQEIIMTDIIKIKFIDCKFSDDTYFKKNFEYLEFYDCIFDGFLDMSNCTITNFKCENTDFQSYVAIDNVDFQSMVNFKYVSFIGHLYIRDTTFEEGIELSYANLEKEMTFFNNQGLGRTKSIENTSQETYRIIKYQLEKVGNIIGANEYQALELVKYRKNIWKKMKDDFLDCKFISNKLLDGVVLFFHWLSSNNSRNWLVTLIWIFIVGSGTSYLLGLYITWENTFKYLSIINFDESLKKMPIIAVLNKVLLGYLYYQFLTAIRKNTRK